MRNVERIALLRLSVAFTLTCAVYIAYFGYLTPATDISAFGKFLPYFKLRVN